MVAHAFPAALPVRARKIFRSEFTVYSHASLRFRHKRVVRIGIGVGLFPAGAVCQRTGKLRRGGKMLRVEKSQNVQVGIGSEIKPAEKFQNQPVAKNNRGIALTGLGDGRFARPAAFREHPFSNSGRASLRVGWTPSRVFCAEKEIKQRPAKSLPTTAFP